MKRLFAAILCLCLLAGCGRTDSTGNTCRAEEGSGESMVSDTMGGSGEKAVSAGETFRIIQEQPESMLLAKTDGNSADVYTLSLRDAELTLDGNAFDRNELGAYQSFPDGTHGPGGRRHPPLEGRLLVHHCGAERAGQHPCGTGQQKYYRRRPAAPYRRGKRCGLPTASGGGRTRTV